MKTITIELQSEDYNPLTIKEEESTTHKGGGSIYSAIIGTIAEATDNKYIKDKFDRLHKEDTKHIEHIMENAFMMAEKEVKYLMDNFYKKPNDKI